MRQIFRQRLVAAERSEAALGYFKVMTFLEKCGLHVKKAFCCDLSSLLLLFLG